MGLDWVDISVIEKQKNTSRFSQDFPGLVKWQVCYLLYLCFICIILYFECGTHHCNPPTNKEDLSTCYPKQLMLPNSAWHPLCPANSTPPPTHRSAKANTALSVGPQLREATKCKPQSHGSPHTSPTSSGGAFTKWVLGWLVSVNDCSGLFWLLHIPWNGRLILFRKTVFWKAVRQSRSN